MGAPGPSYLGTGEPTPSTLESKPTTISNLFSHPERIDIGCHPERSLARSRAKRSRRTCGCSFRKLAAHASLLFFLLLSAATLSFAQSAPRFSVLLDAAHGPDDPGALLPKANSTPTPEKDITLALSVRLRSLLAARGLTVVTTRESDTSIDAQHRAEIANSAKAQACLILHASTTGTGIHLFFSALPPAQPGLLLPWKTAQAASIPRSIALAGVLNASLHHAGMKVTLARASVNPIDSLNCPAVAVEVAPEPQQDGRSLSPQDTAYQTRVAEAIAAALLEWRATPPEKTRQP